MTTPKVSAPLTERAFARKKPCSECPFSKITDKVYTGGNTPEVYIGQICGPFLLSCHCDPDYDPGTGDDKKGQPEIMQCAGAAVFRANVGVASFMPSTMHHLPMDTDTVDATFEEFYARQAGVSLEEAKARLKKTPPDKLLMAELQKVGMDKIILIPKEG